MTTKKLTTDEKIAELQARFGRKKLDGKVYPKDLKYFLPLTLSDVLGAIWKHSEYAASLKMISETSAYLVLFHNMGNEEKDILWDLSHNLLRDQSEETIGEIYELLK